MKTQTLISIFWQRVKEMPERPAILHKVDGSFCPVIWREHGKVVELLAGGLLKQQVKKSDKVAIMSQSRPHWTWADLAIMSVGAVTVPIYPTLAYPEADYLLRHSDAIGLFVENEKQLEKFTTGRALPPLLRFVVLMEGKTDLSLGDLKIYYWEDLLKDGEVYLPNHKQELPQLIEGIMPEDLATIVYTSGTTGVPKGVMLLHRNIFSVCQSMSPMVGFIKDDLALSFLPLSHVYERIGGQFMAIHEGLVLAYAQSMETVAQNLMEVRPTIINGVPRFFEKVYNRLQLEIRRMSKPQQYLIRWALALGKRAARYKEKQNFNSDEIVRRIYRAELRVAERLVFSRIRRRFGGRLRFMVSGAAPLSSEVQLFFETIGIPIVEGYGLTETAAPVACNPPSAIKRGYVGKPLPGVQFKVAADGELMVKGDNVFAGYYKNEAATEECFVDGWFLTGDIGEIDADGYIKIKDRKKDIIITSGGKHVAPQYLENLFVGEGLISHILVYGDRRKYITALITLNGDGLRALACDKEIAYKQVEELTQHPLVIEEIARLVNHKNQRLASFEQIKKFQVLERDFSVENNELTPTMKVKRKVITERYKSLLDSLYESEDLEVENLDGR